MHACARARVRHDGVHLRHGTEPTDSYRWVQDHTETKAELEETQSSAQVTCRGTSDWYHKAMM